MTGADDAALADRLYREGRDWAGALAAWERLGAAVPMTLERQLGTTHCRIELASSDALETIQAPGPAAPSDGRRDDYVALIRSRVYALIVAADWPRAGQLTRLLATVDAHLQHVYATAIRPAAGTGAALPEPPGLGTPPPHQQDEPLAEVDVMRLLARHAGARVLFVARHAHGARPGILHDITFHLRASAAAQGLAVDGIESAPAADALADFPERLRDAIARFRPDVIVCDDLGASGASAAPAIAAAVGAALADARAGGAKLLAYYCDGWYPTVPPLMSALAERVDLFQVCHMSVLSRLSTAAAVKTQWYPFPCTDTRQPAVLDQARLARACIVGRINGLNESRLVWWTEIARSGLPVDLHPTLLGAERTAEDYAALLARYAVGLNFTTRTSGTRIMTGRSLEIPCSGTVLLEEACDDTASFLRPFEHYVPFRTLAELGGRLTALLADPARCGRIAAAGQAAIRQWYDGRHFWARSLRQLYGD